MAGTISYNAKVPFIPKKSIQNATVAKIRTAYGKKLTDDDYKALIATKGVADIVDYLKKNTHYAGIFDDIDPTSIHRGFVETLLHKYHFQKGVEWTSFQNLDGEAFYHHHLMFREIVEILNAIMYLNTGLPEEYIIALPAYLIKKASFDLVQMAKAKDFEQLLAVLKGTPYYGLLKDVKTDENGQVNFNLCEMLLRSYYEKYIFNVIEKDFSGQVETQLLKIFRSQVDLINIINIYRMKEYFKMGEEEIRKNLLHVKGQLSKEVENALLSASDVDTFMRVLSRTSYGKGLEEMKEFEAIYFENKLTKLRARISRRALCTSQSSAVSFYSALYLLEIEIQNIILIIEGVRYEKSRSYLESLIVKI